MGSDVVLRGIRRGGGGESGDERRRRRAWRASTGLLRSSRFGALPQPTRPAHHRGRSLATVLGFGHVPEVPMARRVIRSSSAGARGVCVAERVAQLAGKPRLELARLAHAQGLPLRIPGDAGSRCASSSERRSARKGAQDERARRLTFWLHDARDGFVYAPGESYVAGDAWRPQARRLLRGRQPLRGGGARAARRRALRVRARGRAIPGARMLHVRGQLARRRGVRVRPTADDHRLRSRARRAHAGGLPPLVR